MAIHISKTCNSAFYYLYNLRRIRKYLSKDNTKTLIHAFISSRVDYCNSLLYGLPEYQLNKLQRVQNMCARLICNESKLCHITPLLVDLHWLPVKFRIEFKILLIVFKIFKGLAPSYLSFLITPKPVSKYNLRSSSDKKTVKLICITQLQRDTGSWRALLSTDSTNLTLFVSQRNISRGYLVRL